jgi:phosphatidylethanolamine-binding protein (PEBP) family uncharacterized protein
VCADQAKKHGVITDVLDDFNESVPLTVSYGANKVDHGNELTPTQVKDHPKVSYQGDSNALYTLIMTDPDAPSRQNPKNAEWWHWGIINIPGSDISKGDEVVGYVGAGPPQGTGLHRYVLILCKQSEKIDFPTDRRRSNTNADRAHFKARQLFKDLNLTPVGVNFFQAQYDDYVPTLYAQFK